MAFTNELQLRFCTTQLSNFFVQCFICVVFDLLLQARQGGLRHVRVPNLVSEIAAFIAPRFARFVPSVSVSVCLYIYMLHVFKTCITVI